MSYCERISSRHRATAAKYVSADFLPRQTQTHREHFGGNALLIRGHFPRASFSLTLMCWNILTHHTNTTQRGMEFQWHEQGKAQAECIDLLSAKFCRRSNKLISTILNWHLLCFGSCVFFACVCSRSRLSRLPGAECSGGVLWKVRVSNWTLIESLVQLSQWDKV